MTRLLSVTLNERFKQNPWPHLFRWARLITWDVFRALVLIPATMVGTLILVFALLDEKPVSSFLESMYENRDEVGDVAGDGLITIRDCLGTRKTPYANQMPICDEYGTKSVTIAEAVKLTIRDLGMVYIPLTFFSFLGLVLCRNWSQYRIQTEQEQ